MSIQDNIDTSLIGRLVEHRNVLHIIETNLRNDLTEVEMSGETRSGQRREVAAQLTLAFRHCEDARMRIGKVLQHLGDGDSVFDTKPVLADEKVEPAAKTNKATRKKMPR